MNLNLIMAGVWFIVAVGWFGAVWVRRDLSVLPPIFALVLCAYNVVRWRLRPRRRSQTTLEEALEARRRMHRGEDRPHGPPDPNFNFTDAPPAPEPRRNDPPSPN